MSNCPICKEIGTELPSICYCIGVDWECKNGHFWNTELGRVKLGKKHDHDWEAISNEHQKTKRPY